MARPNDYDVIVIGGGHAGAEAAWAACNLLAGEAADVNPSAHAVTDSAGGLTPAAPGVGGGGRVALITMDPGKIGAMSCNPAIGGLAKGQMVREIDALGGLMGLAADATGIQFRVLNQSKGPAVRGPRSQNDKYAYAAEVRRLLGTRPNLDVLAGTVEDFLVEDGRCRGVVWEGTKARRHEGTEGGRHGGTEARRHEGAETETLASLPPSVRSCLRASAVVLTTGTFMRALMHAGPEKTRGGRIGEGSAEGISGALRRLGFELGRLKTGTPPRLAAESLDVAGLDEQPGDEEPTPFSAMTGAFSDRLSAWVSEPGRPRPGVPGLGNSGSGRAGSLDANLGGSGRAGSLGVYERVSGRFPVLEQRVCWVTHTNAATHHLIRANLDRAPMYNGQIDTAGPRYCPSIEDKVVRFADRTSHHVFLEPESLSTNEVYCNGISTSLPVDIQKRIVHALPGCERAVMLKPGYAVEYDMVWPHQIDATCMTKRVAGLFLAGQINGTSGYEEAAGQGLIAGLNAVRYVRGQDPVRLGRERAYLGVMLDDLVTKTPREPYRMFTSRAEHRLRLRADNAESRLTPLGRELGLVDDARWAVFEAYEAIRKRMEAGEVCPAAGQASERRVRRRLDADRLYAGYIDRSEREMQRLAEREQVALPNDLDFTRVKGLRAEAAGTLNRFRPATLGQAGRLAGVNPADLMLVSVALSR